MRSTSNKFSVTGLLIRNPAYLAILAWVFVGILSLIILMPNSDDPFYYFPALGYLASHHLAMPIGPHENFYLFTGFPTFAFLQSGFLILLKMLHIPQNFYSYRLFIFVSFIALLAVSIRNINGHKADIRRFLFIVLLGISPYAHSWILNRPGTLGLLFLMLHILLFNTWIKNDSKFLVILSGLLLGTTVCLHPGFAPPAFFIFVADMIVLYKKNKLKHLWYFLISIGVPAIWMVSFLQLHAPDSWDQFFRNLGAFSKKIKASNPFETFAQFAFLQSKRFASHSIRIVYSLYYLPTTLAFIYCLFRIPFMFYHKQVTQDHIYPICIFISVFFVMEMTWGSSYIFGRCSFYTLFAFVNILDSKSVDFLYELGKKKSTLIPSLIISFTIIGSYQFIHIIKFIHWPNQYMLPPKVLNKIDQLMDKNGQMLVIESEYLSLFTKYFYQDFLAKGDKAYNQNKVLFMPIGFRRVASKHEKNWTLSYLKDNVVNKETSLVMIHKKRIQFSLNDKRKLCLHLPHSINLSATLMSKKLETGPNWIVKLKDVSFGCNT